MRRARRHHHRAGPGESASLGGPGRRSRSSAWLARRKSCCAGMR
jgi:hypothetical protein